MDMILYEDKDLIVCHKPSGIPVQSARIGQKDMVSILNNYLAQKGSGRRKGSQKEGTQEIFVVHRLDQPVEGVIVFAKNKKAAAGLSKQITDGSMKKVYQAVVCVKEMGRHLIGNVVSDTGDKVTEELKGNSAAAVGNNKIAKAQDEKLEMKYDLADYLVKNGRTNTSSVVSEKSKDAKKAELSFMVLGCRSLKAEAAKDADEQRLDGKKNSAGKKNYALVEIDLKTGRHHQIRVQMSHAGLPLYGDQKYHEGWREYVLGERVEAHESDRVSEPPQFWSAGPLTGGSSVRKNPALALCSVRLTFKNPSTGGQMEFETKPTTEAFRIFE